MNTWEDFDSEAKTIESFTKAQVPDCVQLLQDAVGLFADAFSISAGTTDITDENKAKMSLLSQNFNTLKCAVDLALRGYYSQSMNLTRHVYENWVAYHYLIKKPQKAHVLLNGKINKRLPSHSDMLKELDEDFLKEQMKDWYDVLCCFAHPHAVGVLSLISNTFVSDETSIHYGTTYADDRFRASVYAISIWTCIMLAEIGQWIPDTNEWYQKRSILEEKVIRFIGEENKKSRDTSRIKSDATL